MIRWIFLFFVLFVNVVALANPQYQIKDLTDCAWAQQLRVGRESVFQAESQLATAKAENYPTLEASLSTTQTQIPGLSERSQLSRISLQQKVIDFSRSSGISAAQAGVNANQTQLAGQAMDQTVNIIQALANLHKLLEQKKFLENQVVSFESLVKILSAGTRAGLADSTDLFQARASLLSGKSELDQLSFEIQKQKDEFVANYNFQPIPFFSVATPTEDADIKVENLPQLRSLTAAVKQAELQKEQLDRDMWPEVSVSLGYSDTSLNGQRLPSSPATEGTVGVVVDLSGFWKGSGNRTAQAGIREQRRNSYFQELQQLKNQYSLIDQELKLIESRMPILQERIDIAAKTKELFRVKLRLGRVSFVDLQSAEQSIFQASIEYSDSQVRQAQLKLQKKVASDFTQANLRGEAVCRLKK